jgi:glycosyltransferase involved in cell wall biosynthesis
MTAANSTALDSGEAKSTSLQEKPTAFKPGGLPAPYFATAAPDSSRRPRILLLSYHFPPSPAAGALRWQKFAGLVAERGWGLDVIALDPTQLKRAEQDRYNDLPPGTRLFGVREDKLLLERLEHVAWRVLVQLRSVGRRRNGAPAQTRAGAPSPVAPTLTIDQLTWRLWHPDGWRRAYYAWIRFAQARAWARRAAAVACAVRQPGIHQVIISCGPPHLIHEAGRLVSEATGLPLVVDMRDPWTLQHRFPEYEASPLQFRLAATTERRIIDRASLVVMNTPPAAELMARSYPTKRIVWVLNGYDEESLPPIPPRTRFVIAYAGSIYLDRDPRLIFRAAARVVRELRLTPDQFGFEFIGSTDNFNGRTPVEELAVQEGLGVGYVRTGGERPRKEAMAFLAGASLLLSLPQDATYAIPSKVYEYMRFPAWLLALTEKDSATDRILADTGADVLRPDDVDGMAQVLRRCFEAFAAGERPSPIARDARLSRRYQADRLLQELEGITARAGTR